jgi:hypothetical protein
MSNYSAYVSVEVEHMIIRARFDVDPASRLDDVKLFVALLTQMISQSKALEETSA